MARWQWLVVPVVFILPIIGFALWMAYSPPPPGSESIIVPGFIGFILLNTVVIIGFGSRGRGAELTWIVAPSGIRGEFALRRMLLWGMLPFCLLVIFLTVALLREDADVSAREGIAAIIVLAGFTVVPLVLLLRGVHALRVDEDGSLWLYRRLGGWSPLNLTDYGQVTNVVQIGRSFNFTRALRFTHPVSGQRALELNLTGVQSRLYGTTVPGVVVEGYFMERLEQAGFIIRKTSFRRWVAEHAGS
jgi:hypothetical protein